ncbi:MAG: NHL repeat-containing protein [Pseudomonadota bacterium]|jgi:hypothetical protein|nr:NHL repeat-containing protein [Pseudomonadota bacterium]
MPMGLCAAAPRRSHLAASLRRMIRTAFMPLFAAALLSACGGGGDDDDFDLVSAYQVLGQSGFSGASANQGNGNADAGTLAQPLGNIATNGSVLFVADSSNNRVLGFKAMPATNGASADFVLGQDDFTSSVGGIGRNKLALPASVFLGNGYLVVADSGNNRVLIWNSIPASATDLPDVVIGQSDFTTKTSGTSETALAYPTSAIVAGNSLIVVDQNNNRVLVWDQVPSSSGEPANLVLGQSDFTTKTADDEADEMNRPASAWSDGVRLLVSDSGNNRVLYWSLLPQTSGEEADYVIGQSDFGRSTSGTSASALRTPYGVTSDGTSVWIADSGNNRVLEFGSFPIANQTSANSVIGQDEDSFTSSTANDDDQDGDVDDEPSSRTLSGATGVYANNGTLYVTDRSNNRVLFFPQ